MAIPASLVGMTAGPMHHEIDERWTMAYAAAIGDTLPVYFDTTRAGGVVAHPIFSVCPEWPVIVATREESVERGVPQDEVITSVHATHDVTIHRLIRPGDRLTTTLETVGLVQKSPGAMSITRLHTVDADGRPVATTTQNGIYLGVPLDGADTPDPAPPAPLGAIERLGTPTEIARPVDAGAAHTYTECARIWNPIHTDRAVAQSAGLPDIILHGTANLAHGVSAVIDHSADGQPAVIRRVVCRFAAMVPMPATLTVRIWEPVANSVTQPADEIVVPFEVLNDAGEPAVKDGLIVVAK